MGFQNTTLYDSFPSLTLLANHIVFVRIRDRRERMVEWGWHFLIYKLPSQNNDVLTWSITQSISVGSPHDNPHLLNPSQIPQAFFGIESFDGWRILEDQVVRQIEYSTWICNTGVSKKEYDTTQSKNQNVVNYNQCQSSSTASSWYLFRLFHRIEIHHGVDIKGERNSPSSRGLERHTTHVRVRRQGKPKIWCR